MTFLWQPDKRSGELECRIEPSRYPGSMRKEERDLLTCQGKRPIIKQ